MADEVTAREVARKIANGDEFVLLDVRSARAYGRGHLPGAVSMPYASFEPAAVSALIEPDAPVIVYCYIGVASAKVADALCAVGFSDVKSMAGGHAVWRLLGCKQLLQK